MSLGVIVDAVGWSVMCIYAYACAFILCCMCVCAHVMFSIVISDLLFWGRICDFSFSGYLEQSATGKMTVVTV